MARSKKSWSPLRPRRQGTPWPLGHSFADVVFIPSAGESLFAGLQGRSRGLVSVSWYHVGVQLPHLQIHLVIMGKTEKLKTYYTVNLQSSILAYQGLREGMP